MRRSLKWLLASTAGASLVTVWLNPDGRGSSAVVGASDAHTAGTPPNASADPFANWRASAIAASSSASEAKPLPLAFPDRDLTAGQRDIFTPVSEPALPPSVVAAPPPPAPSAPAPPPEPVAPPVLWHAAGAMTTPDGERLAWLSKGNGEVAVNKGTELDDGYVVQDIEQEAVILLYPALGTTSKVALPQAPAASP